MMLTMSRRAPSFLASWMNATPLPSSPVGSTGTVTETLRPGLADSRALIAAKRRLIVVGSAIAAPSMSKSTCERWYWLITDWYAACREVVFVQDWASSTPPAPPKDTMTWAPADWAAEMSPETVGSLVTGSVSPQMAVQPLPITNAAVNALRPPPLIAALSIGSWLLVMST